MDTLKTRLQSERGFWRSGGFKSVYKGIIPTAAGSAPTAALFFCTYEGCKSFLSQHVPKNQMPFVHMTAASLAEIVACFIRVPVEIVKQRRQALNFKYGQTSAFQILLNAYKNEGLIKGVYRGFGSTILREIPFSLIQFPLWEFFKANWEETTNTELTSSAVAICGALAGGISAGLTTPLDVAKTRIMLADQEIGRTLTVPKVILSIYREKGFFGIFAGFVPRVMWITIGGFIFFGVYDFTSRRTSDRTN